MLALILVMFVNMHMRQAKPRVLCQMPEVWAGIGVPLWARDTHICARDAQMWALCPRRPPPSMALGWCILAQTEDASLRRLTQAFEIKMVNTQVYTDAAARNAEAIRLFWSL